MRTLYPVMAMPMGVSAQRCTASNAPRSVNMCSGGRVLDSATRSGAYARAIRRTWTMGRAPALGTENTSVPPGRSSARAATRTASGSAVASSASAITTAS